MSGLSETGFGHLGTYEVTKRRYGPDERTLARRARVSPVVAVLQQSPGAAPANEGGTRRPSASGQQHTDTFAEDELLRRYAKA